MLQSVCYFRRSFCHILANFVAIIPFRSSFERVFPKNVSILRFKLHFGRIFVQNALILLFRTSFGRIFRKNVTILPLFVVRLIAAVVFISAPGLYRTCCFPQLSKRLIVAATSSEKLCLSRAKLFQIPVPAASFGHVFAPNHIRLAVSLGTSGLKPLLLRGFAITVFCNLLIISYAFLPPDLKPLMI